MASVEVFVDDAVSGRLPDVCVKTGAPSAGRLRIEQTRGGVGFAVLLVFFGPIGWIVLLVLAVMSRRETLTVRLPYSEAAVDHERRLTRARLTAGGAAIAFAILAVAARSIPPLSMLCGCIALAAALAVVVTHVWIAWIGVNLKLDASRRWVTLSRVHPAFAEAVRRRDATTASALSR